MVNLSEKARFAISGIVSDSLVPADGAARLIGRKVAWPAEKHKAIGKIVALHGKNGLVRARFIKGVPGQALGSPVEIIG